MSPLLRSRAVLWLLTLLMLACLSCGRSEPAGGRLLRMATTTSMKDSGLLEELLPAFEKKTGHRVEVSAVGSGKALKMLHDGAADLAVTHAPAEEQAAVASGEVGTRTPFMHNEFVIAGPAELSSVVAGAGDAAAAFKAIAASGKKLISRGDGSGTQQREGLLLAAAGIAPAASFIVDAGAGMGETLSRASEEGAFVLSDRATFLAKRKELKLAIVFQGDAALRNTYAVVEPKASAGPPVNAPGARAFADFVTSPEGRALIGAFGVKTHGEPLFTPEQR
jgi:tungstate transport system substrate-binding protein